MWKNLKWLGSNRRDFFELSAPERRYLLGKTLLVTLFLDYFFYRSFWAFLPLCGIGAGYYQLEKRVRCQKKKEAAREEFKELMLTAATGQKAGYSAENAFLSSYQDMKGLFGEDSSVCRILRFLKSGRENNTSFSVLWMQMGNQIDLEEITEFAQVYEISQRSSGNMAAVMEKTADIIIQKIETEKEIAVLISARRLEQKIMNIMPFAIMSYINITSPFYFQDLYHSFAGALIMSFCLFVYICAYVLSVHMISIEI
ncbi:MAG: hypothetical protein K2H52_08255 [Lachnospiraceae bacterium]|nr:hypothetical protein [Lachnospiraceae bacterium]MDE6186154.1 hypothetical protein [Lachnospiraceae bacterium]MDE7285223.1 hypothetical protein [Lachnospiraceae bacterium]